MTYSVTDPRSVRDIFMYYTVMHKIGNNYSRLAVSTYIQAILDLDTV